MTHEELIAKAVERVRLYERHAQKAPDRIRGLKVDEMPRRTVREAAVVYFESDSTTGRIEVVLDSHSGEVLEIKLIPPKEKADEKSR
jgi:hypothetical protein